MTSKQQSKRKSRQSNGELTTVPMVVGNQAVVEGAEIINGTLHLKGTKEAFGQLEQAFGTSCENFISYGLGQLINMLRLAGAKEDCTFELKVVLTQMAAVRPSDPAEAMAAIQMVCAHHASVEMTQRAVSTERVDFKPIYGNLANKFSRSYLAHMEGLARVRRDGRQTVVHQHVNVEDGARAVVANTVTSTPR